MPASTRANVQAFQEGSVLRALRGAFRNPVAILKGLGALGIAYAQRAFRDQRLGDVKWKTRDETGMNPNWPGILMDYHRGRAKPAADRFRGAPVLIDQGTLRRSISMRLLGKDAVEVGSNLPYAGPLHAGEETQSPPITEGFQRWLYGLMTGARDGVRRAEAAPERRERREVRAAQTSDPVLGRLQADVMRSKAAYAGQKVPKGERERLRKVAAQIKARKAVVEREAVGRSVSMTGDEASRLAKARAGSEQYDQLKWLLNKNIRGTTIPIKHPARPFVGVPPDMAREAERSLGVIIGGAR